MKLLKLDVENDDKEPPEKGNVNDKDDHGNEEEITDEVPNEDNETDVGLEAGLLEPLEPGIGAGKESGDIGDVSLECVVGDGDATTPMNFEDSNVENDGDGSPWKGNRNDENEHRNEDETPDEVPDENNENAQVVNEMHDRNTQKPQPHL